MGVDDYCTKQYNSVNHLFIIAQSCEFIFGVVAGVSLDKLGPFFTGSVSLIMHLTGVLLFIYSKETMVAYVPATIFFAGAINMSCFPMLALADMFPKWKSLMMSIIVAAQLVATMMSPVLKAIWDLHPNWTFRTVFGGYLAIIFLPLGICYLLSLPMSRADLAPGDDEADVSAIEIATVEEASNSAAAKAAAAADQPAATTADEVLVKVSDTLEQASSKDKQVDGQLDQQTEQSFIVIDGRKRRKTYNIWQQFASMDYIMFALWYILQIVIYGYYPTTVLDEAGKNVSDFLGYIGPSQALFGVLLGLIVDYTLTMPIAFSINVMIALVYFLALIRSTPLEYITAILYTISNSYIYTTKYTYIGEMYPARGWGTLIGTMGAAAGFMNLVNIPIQNLNAYISTCIAYGVIGGSSILILLWLWSRSRKGINYLDIIG